MNLTDFINLSIDRRYRGRTIADTMGNPFVVRYITGGPDEDSYEAVFYEELPIKSDDLIPVEQQPRSRYVRHNDSMPDILNLRYDKTIKAWVPNPISPLS